MGTIVNIIAILIGSSIGMAGKKIVDDKIEASIKNVLGLSTIIVGILGIITSSITINKNGTLQSNSTLLLVISLVIGTLVGELLDIDTKITNVIKKFEEKFSIGGFSDGFIPASVLFCTGAMAIVGALNDGLLNDPTILYTKSILDGVVAILFTATLGFGVFFSSVSVGVYQGSITLLGIYLSPYLSDALVNNICLVGYAMVVSIGLDLMKIKEIKVLNMLPGLLVPIIYALIF
ncbi:DUF554 domain-containing protein [Anaerofustis stercorihominis]|uniref:Transport protein n=1 Tax=Anaerofustis stercorihominis DSM 17244 TaxID=445971 RepID=B1CB13_9FIRM|nr:DUF554 domain-containing protein [Anaerofustis stercorihominis]EDS71460.1 hypothetical protein ANASTE_01162 [Anaerofustis stercorihominis DSM 17244]MCQ4795412.1 DUF554 domain-containing protein [Anaerofustis stercorihominis]